MRYVCRDCGAVFSSEDLSSYVEDVGYCDGVTYYGERACCPECGSDDYVEGSKCLRCDLPTEADDLYGGICLHCLMEALTVEAGLKYLQAMQEVEEFTEWMEADIKDLPRPALLEGLQEFILDDEAEAFAEWLEDTEDMQGA